MRTPFTNSVNNLNSYGFGPKNKSIVITNYFCFYTLPFTVPKISNSNTLSNNTMVYHDSDEPVTSQFSEEHTVAHENNS